MAERELVVPVASIEKIEIVCQQSGCAGSITVNFLKTDQPHADCPMCKHALGGAVWKMATAWRDFHADAIKSRVQFRIKFPE
jgi:hypothetical protein